MNDVVNMLCDELCGRFSGATFCDNTSTSPATHMIIINAIKAINVYFCNEYISIEYNDSTDYNECFDDDIRLPYSEADRLCEFVDRMLG